MLEMTNCVSICLSDVIFACNMLLVIHGLARI